MKKNLLFIFAALFIFLAQAQNTLKLMSYNIKNANGMDNLCNFQRIANVINNTSPDAVSYTHLDVYKRQNKICMYDNVPIVFPVAPCQASITLDKSTA